MSWKKNLPNWLTLSRIFVSPLLMVLIYLNEPFYHYLAAATFIAASITDYFDGMFARMYQVESSLGKLMDPVADKILVAVPLIMLIPTGRIGPVMVILFLTRDILIGGIRSVAASSNVIISARPTGKWKAALQMIAIPLVLVNFDFEMVTTGQIGYWMLWVAVALSMISAAEYIIGYFKGRKSFQSS